MSESVLAAYNHGDDLGTACKGNGHHPMHSQLSLYHMSDLPVLDHPFVEVRWPGEYTTQRQRAIDDFRDWLGDDALTRFGFRTGTGEIAPPNGTNPLLQDPDLHEGGDGSMPETVAPHRLRGQPACTGPLQHAFACYLNARPQIALSLLIDVSGSMTQLAGPQGKSSILLAQEVAADIVARAHPEDQIGVGTFSTTQHPKLDPPRLISSNAQLDSLQVQIRRITQSGKDLRLTEAIREATRKLLNAGQTLVVLTDGQTSRSNPDIAREAPGLAHMLHSKNSKLRIFIVQIGPKGCAERPVKPLADALGKRSCINGSASQTEAIPDNLMSSILRVDQ
jgi:hypothetical protein